MVNVNGLDDALGSIFIGLFLDVAKVLCLGFLVAESLLVTVQEDVVRTDAARNVFLFQERNGLLLGKSCHEVAKHFYINFAVLLHKELCQ